MADISNITVSVEGVNTVCDIKDKVARNDIALNRTTLGTQCKNLVKNNAVTQTVSGVTFTINDDKSITVNGTATAQISFLISRKVGLGIGNYILTGCPSGGSNNTFYLTAYASSAWLKSPDFGSGCRIENKTVTHVVISIASGYTANNLKFYPMLRYADITDSTYEPYSDNVDTRLTKNKSDIAVIKSTVGYQCKNLHDTLSVNWYQPGKTSVASDGTVTATMTSDPRSFAYANSEHYITLEAGNYIITANTLKFAAGSSALIRGCNSDNQSLFALSVSSAGLHKATFSLSEKTTIGIMYKLYSQTCTIMIRDADILDDTYEPYKENIDERLIKNKSDIAVNKTTLGYQCKNLLKLYYPFGHKYTNSTGTVTWTFNDDYSVSMVANSKISSGVAYQIAEITLKKGTYLYSVEGYSTPNITHTQLYSLNTDGSWKWLANFSAIENKIIVTEETTYSFRAYRNSAVTVGVTETFYPMLRYADILDDTYEPYQPSLKEQVPYSISLPSKSTSESYSYNGVPTMICLTPSESVSSGGGLYLINSVGTAVYLIDKTGIVINTDTTNKTFTITNNTASTYDVYISCAYKKE